jgi:hypothetical protein
MLLLDSVSPQSKIHFRLSRAFFACLLFANLFFDFQSQGYYRTDWKEKKKRKMQHRSKKNQAMMSQSF